MACPFLVCLEKYMVQQKKSKLQNLCNFASEKK